MTPADYAKKVLMDHQQQGAGCYCQREILDTSHAEHLINMLQEAGLEIVDQDDQP